MRATIRKRGGKWSWRREEMSGYGGRERWEEVDSHGMKE